MNQRPLVNSLTLRGSNWRRLSSSQSFAENFEPPNYLREFLCLLSAGPSLPISKLSLTACVLLWILAPVVVLELVCQSAVHNCMQLGLRFSAVNCQHTWCIWKFWIILRKLLDTPARGDVVLPGWSTYWIPQSGALQCWCNSSREKNFRKRLWANQFVRNLRELFSAGVVIMTSKGRQACGHFHKSGSFFAVVHRKNWADVLRFVSYESRGTFLLRIFLWKKVQFIVNLNSKIFVADVVKWSCKVPRREEHSDR